MKIDRVLELLKIERECVTRQSPCNEKSKLCDRNCGECDIAQNDLELIEMYDFVISMIETLSGRSQWISVKDRMPKAEQKVLVSIKTAYGNRYTTVAAHVGYHERNSESDGWSLECEIDWDEYDEENDWYWVPECWYEVNFVDDNTNWIIDKVDGEITHWMPLPEQPEWFCADGKVKEDG